MANHAPAPAKSSSCPLIALNLRRGRRFVASHHFEHLTPAGVDFHLANVGLTARRRNGQDRRWR